ncbi:VOC family protein [Dietzia sp. CH92]|uniref:VOC family protein n=1 Tax=Dietzia sp. CH92 TaxID=3051823 RepID=UPI0028D33A99|nr:VOC family protein [Dietzia sp. CH92]
MAEMTTCLWFATEAQEAAEFYCSVFPRSAIRAVDTTPVDTPGPSAGDVLLVEFELDGRPFIALNGGTAAEYTDAVSLEIRCETQDEIDHYWNGLLAGGGQEVQCGWLIDRYGLRWQVAPQMFYRLARGGDVEAARRAFTAMLGMVKLDIARIDAAARGD